MSAPELELKGDKKSRSLASGFFVVLATVGLSVLVWLGVIVSEAPTPPLELCDPDFPDLPSELTIPNERLYPDTIRLRVVLPCKYMKSKYEGPFSFRSINYRTGNPSIDSPSIENADLVSVIIRRSPYEPESEAHRHWKRYPGGGEYRFDLAYHPQVVPSRPETHWRVAYFKEGVSGEDFHIICWPKTPGFSFAPQEWCTMEIAINPTLVRDRKWSARLTIGFRVEKLADWPKIEATARKVFANTEVQ